MFCSISILKMSRLNPKLRAHGCFISPPIAFLLPIFLCSCTGTAIIQTRPPQAQIEVNGKPIEGNTLRFGRWIGNEYVIRASAPGYRTTEQVIDVYAGKRSLMIALTLPVLGVAVIPWNGQIEETIYLDLDRFESHD